MPPRKTAVGARAAFAAAISAQPRFCAARASSQNEKSKSRSLGIQCGYAISGCSAFVVGAKIGCWPWRHQPPKLSGVSLAQRTSSAASGFWPAAVFSS